MILLLKYKLTFYLYFYSNEAITKGNNLFSSFFFFFFAFVKSSWFVSVAQIVAWRFVPFCTIIVLTKDPSFQLVIMKSVSVIHQKMISDFIPHFTTKQNTKQNIRQQFR